MKKFVLLLSLITTTLILSPWITPAQAQATRTWVSGVGDDVNPCSRTAPCKTFASAISKTAAKGEINCLDSGGFGSVTITKSITILCRGTIGGVLAGPTHGITINAGPTDRVVLDGLDIEGSGTGLNGVNVLAGKEVYVIHTSIRGFTQNGVNMASSTDGGRVFIYNSYVLFNAGGVNVVGPANSGTINNTQIEGNTSFSVQGNVGK